jgi:hypothetical protein
MSNERTNIQDSTSAAIPIPDEMIRDLGMVAAPPIEPLREVARCLKETHGVITRDLLREQISSFVPEEAFDAVAATVQTIRPRSKAAFLQVVDQWRMQDPENLERISDEHFNRLEANLDALVGDYPGLQLMRKADLLLRDTGNEFESVKFLCDLRPVFDDDHTHVEGYVLLANLRFRYHDQAGTRKAFELALTEDELDLLASEVSDAQQKIEVLKRLTKESLRGKHE